MMEYTPITLNHGLNDVKKSSTKFRGGKTIRRKIRKQKKNKKSRKTSNQMRKIRKNKIRPIIYGGASLKQYGIATALRSLIFTYFPHNKGFETINYYNPELNKYELSNRYTTVMDLLNQIVHNDDGRSTLPREDKFGNFLTYSKDLDIILSDIISEIKQYIYNPKVINRFSPKEINEISGLINSIHDELVITTGLSSEKVLPEQLTANVASAKRDNPGRTRISVASIFSKVSSNDRQSKYPKMCDYLRSMFPEKSDKASRIAFDFFENTPMSKEDLAEILDLFKQSLDAGYIGPEYGDEIQKLEEEIDKK